MARSELIGSWYNSGYHGHFRSKSRSDFVCEYRHLAKPIPPKSFVKRTKDNVAKHSFSHHDNRHSFMNDALYFEEGLGRRRIRNSTNRYQSDLLAWHPESEELKRTIPKMSVYKIDFHNIPPSETFKQKITQRPKTSFDDNFRVSTSYRYAHGKDNPNKEVLSAMSNVGLSTTDNRKHKASFITGRESVASCLNWYIGPPSAGNIPHATQTCGSEGGYSFVPHPPTTTTPTVDVKIPETTAPTVTVAE